MRFRPTLLILLLLALLAGCKQNSTEGTSSRATGGTVAIAAAADLKFALDEIITEFTEQYPETQVQVTYGSSGNFFAQLTNKAPFDIYFSADIAYPRKLIETGHALKESEFKYAVGQIVLWVRNESQLAIEQQGILTLLDPSVRKIAIANPQHAPYGKAAEAALKHLGLHEQLADRLVLGENIAQTAQFVESGAADAGIIALSLAMAPALKAKGRYWVIPQEAYPALEQGGVILSWAQDRAAAERLRSFVMEERGRAVLSRYGFLVPGE